MVVKEAMEQALQLAGAVMILAAFGLAQLKRLAVDSYPYLILNVFGAGLLGWAAWIGSDWGFLLLEVVWFAFSGIGLGARLIKRSQSPV